MDYGVHRKAAGPSLRITTHTHSTYETHTHDGMVAKIIHVACRYDERPNKSTAERFDVEIDITTTLSLGNTFDTLYGARQWIIEQFSFPRSILILKHSNIIS